MNKATDRILPRIQSAIKDKNYTVDLETYSFVVGQMISYLGGIENKRITKSEFKSRKASNDFKDFQTTNIRKLQERISNKFTKLSRHIDTTNETFRVMYSIISTNEYDVDEIIEPIMNLGHLSLNMISSETA